MLQSMWSVRQGRTKKTGKNTREPGSAQFCAMGKNGPGVNKAVDRQCTACTRAQGMEVMQVRTPEEKVCKWYDENVLLGSI